MATLTNHLIRRGMETLHSSTGRISFERVHEEIQFPRTLVVVLCFTFFFILFGILGIEYTYGNLVATLAAVETPEQTAIIRLSTPENDDAHPDAPLISLDNKPAAKGDIERGTQEVLLLSQRPITSSFRSLRRHFRASQRNGNGRLSAFRGLSVFIIKALLYNLASSLATVFGKPDTILFMIVDAFVYTAFTGLQLTWNHIVISAPSSKTWLARLPSRIVVRKAIKQTLGYALILRSSLLAMMWIAQIVMINYPAQKAVNDIKGPLVMIAYLAFCALVAMYIQIPVQIAITRVRASLLNDEHEPVVPFDKTFNGAVIPESEGGKGVLSLKEAILSVNIQTHRRVLVVYVKTIAMQLGWLAVGSLAVVAELRLFLGPEWREILMKLAAQNVHKMVVAA